MTTIITNNRGGMKILLVSCCRLQRVASTKHGRKLKRGKNGQSENTTLRDKREPKIMSFSAYHGRTVQCATTLQPCWSIRIS